MEQEEAMVEQEEAMVELGAMGVVEAVHDKRPEATFLERGMNFIESSDITSVTSWFSMARCLPPTAIRSIITR